MSTHRGGPGRASAHRRSRMQARSARGAAVPWCWHDATGCGLTEGEWGCPLAAAGVPTGGADDRRTGPAWPPLREGTKGLVMRRAPVRGALAGRTEGQRVFERPGVRPACAPRLRAALLKSWFGRAARVFERCATEPAFQQCGEQRRMSHNEPFVSAKRLAQGGPGGAAFPAVGG